MPTQSHKIEQLSAAVQPAVDICLLKAQSYVEDSTYDELFLHYEASARELIERATGRVTAQAQYAVYLDDYPNRDFRFTHHPISSIESIEALVLDEWTLVPAETYSLGRGHRVQQGVRLREGQSWMGHDGGADSVRISYTAGLAEPMQVEKQAIMMLVSHWWENREASIQGTLNEVPLATQRIIELLKCRRVS